MTKARLLIIDDDNRFREVTAYSLREKGFEVLDVPEGKQGLEKMNGWTPDLILCDLRMPVMDGISFLSEIKARPNAPPVIILSASSNVADIVGAIQTGAIDYLTKPVNRNSLLSAIDHGLSISSQSKPESDEKIR